MNTKAEYINFTFIRGGNAIIGKNTSNPMWCAYNKVNSENKIYLPTYGKAEIFINGTHYTMEKGKVYFIGENEIRSYYVADEKAVFSKRLVHFYADCDIGNIKKALNLPDVIELDENEYQIMHDLLLKISINDGLAKADLSEVFLNKSKIYDIVAYYIYLSQKKNLCFNSDRGGQAKINLMLMQYISNSVIKDISVKELAKELAMNENYFLRYFKDKFNTTPRRLVNKARYDKALGMLLIPNKSIAQIAKSCGFKHESYFCESFKKVFGMSPLKKREELLEKEFAQ